MSQKQVGRFSEGRRTLPGFSASWRRPVGIVRRAMATSRGEDHLNENLIDRDVDVEECAT